MLCFQLLRSAPVFRRSNGIDNKMARDDRFYAFIIAHTTSSSSKIRRFVSNGISSSCWQSWRLLLWLVFRFTAFMASHNKPHTFDRA